ncbi:hypothetical protein JW933_04160, partial [candidate division FCPU426 bacterium]|nr:hypothetical protein [candidate division FCPU426 bacterium]
PARPHAVTAQINSGGGRYGGLVGRLRYDLQLSPDRDLGLSAGVFQDSSVSTGHGLIAAAAYKIGLAKNDDGAHWLSLMPEYAFMLTNYPVESPIFYYDGETMHLYHAFLHMLGCDAAAGIKLGVLELDAHLGPYLGWYAFHSSRDGTIGFNALKLSLRLGLDFQTIQGQLVYSLFNGDAENRAFLDAFLALGVGYYF